MTFVARVVAGAVVVSLAGFATSAVLAGIVFDRSPEASAVVVESMTRDRLGALAAILIAAVGIAVVLISAGDGSVSAYERIRQGRYQIATVPEAAILQGWQLADELNRAFAGQQPSGFQTHVHLVTKENVDADGGKDNRFDPSNDYRGHYKAIWGVN